MLTLVFDDRPRSSNTDSSRVATTWGNETGHTFGVGRVGPDGRSIAWEGIGVFRFDRGPDVRCALDPGVDRAHATDVFARVIQPLVLQALGRPVLHASAVATPDGALVFCGLSGSGKSTTAFALGTRPSMRQIADDAVVMRQTGDSFVVEPIPFRPRLRPTAAAHFHADRTNDPRESASAALPLRAVVVLSQQPDAPAEASPVVTRVPRATAFSTLLTHAHCFDEADRDATRLMVTTYLTMAERVPVLAAAYRPDFGAIDDLARCILDAAGLNESAACRS